MDKYIDKKILNNINGNIDANDYDDGDEER